MLAGQGANLVLQAGCFVLLGRLLGSVQYGIFVGAFAFTSLLAKLQRHGVGNASSAVCKHRDRVVCSLLGECSPYYYRFSVRSCWQRQRLWRRTFSIHQAPHWSCWQGFPNCFFNELTRNAAAVFQAHERMRTTAALNLATNLVRLIGARKHAAPAWSCNRVSVGERVCRGFRNGHDRIPGLCHQTVRETSVVAYISCSLGSRRASDTPSLRQLPRSTTISTR